MDLPSNLWKSPVIKRRLAMEAKFEGSSGHPSRPLYWVSVPEADSKDGSVIIKNFEPDYITMPEPHELQQDFVIGLQKFLMKEAGFNGLWLAGWTHPPHLQGLMTGTDNCWNRMIFIWHDKDGDPQYTLESELPFAEMIAAGMDYYVGLAHQAHQQWREVYSSERLKDDMLLTDQQQTTAALNELKDV